jgi:hypothetical protein
MLSEMIAIQNERWQNLLAELSEHWFIFLLDREGRYCDLRVPDQNRLWCAKDKHIGRKFDEMLPPELGTDRRHFFNQAVLTGKVQEYSYFHPLSQDKHMQCELTPLLDATGRVEGVLMVVKDVVVVEKAAL